jgi:Integrase core domain
MAPRSLRSPSRTESPPLAQEPPPSSWGARWENGYIESYSARLRDELRDGDNVCTLGEFRMVIDSWRRFNDTLWPHGSRGARPPAPKVFNPKSARTAAPAPTLPSKSRTADAPVRIFDMGRIAMNYRHAG